MSIDVERDSEWRDRDKLAERFYRMAGLVDAIELAKSGAEIEREASQAIGGCCSALLRDAVELINAAESGRIRLVGAGDGEPPANAAGGAADPIFAAIERHHALRGVYVRLLNRIDIDGEGRIDADEDQRIFERAARRDAEALNTVAKTAPTTFAGLVAALRYLADYDTETRALQRFVFTVADAYPDLTRIKGAGE